MAEVYAALDMHQDARKVALKLFKDEYTNHELLAEAFKRESQALKELQHPRIVELYDSGIDSETNRHFLVLEWLDLDLPRWLDSHSFPGWDSYYSDFGKPLLEALAFAHNRQVIHRDIKPSNILIDASGSPKLADFGIAKIKHWIEPGRTLQEWVSRPFSPPEWDDGSYTYTRDVFGFATVILYCLTDVYLKSYDDIDKAIEELDAPDEVLAVVKRCLSREPSERYPNAILLLETLDRIQVERSQKWEEIPTYHLQFTGKALNSFKLEFPGESDAAIRKIVLDDLAEVSGFDRLQPKKQDVGDNISSESHFHLYGANFNYHLAIDRITKCHFAILNAWRASSAQLELRRDFSYKPRCRFAFGVPLSAVSAADQLRALVLAIEENEAESRLKNAEKREMELFQTWNRILTAKTDLEKQKETPLLFSESEDQGTRVRFRIKNMPEDDVVGQPRRVLVGDRPVIVGDVESVDAEWLTLFISERLEQAIPQVGKLIFDVAASQTALRRQGDALDAVRFDRAIRPDLRIILARPNEVRPPIPFEVSDYFQKELDEAKKRVVNLACGSQDILLVQGPPGTGKTTFISEVVLQFLRTHPGGRVLVTSQTHVALDNAAEKIRALSNSVRILRLGLHAQEKTAPAVKDLLLPAQMETWRTEVLSNGRLFLDRWAREHSISQHEFSVGQALQEYLYILSDIRSLKDQFSKLKNELSNMLPSHVTSISEGEIQVPPDEDSSDEPDEVISLRADIARLQSEIRKRTLDKEDKAKALASLEPLTNEILEGTESEIQEWIVTLIPDTAVNQKFRNLLGIWTDWENRFGRTQDFRPALLASADVIAGTCIGVVGIKGMLDIDFDLCIVDEASKATPTELLVPMSRSRQWILVGDSKQLPPFEDEALHNDHLLTHYELRREDLIETLFERFSLGLPPECTASLTVQHRMVPEIGNLISECFYDGALSSIPKTSICDLRSVLPKPVSWITTNHLSVHRETKSKFSFSNQSEARVIRKLLDGINTVATQKGCILSVAIISGYLAQIDLLKREMWPRWQALTIECNTVDAFQGREADIAIYSVTRSNDQSQIGFLRDLRRLNVALSRGRYYLIIVGDHLYSKSVQGLNPFRTIIEYIENHSSECGLKQGSL